MYNVMCHWVQSLIIVLLQGHTPIEMVVTNNWVIKDLEPASELNEIGKLKMPTDWLAEGGYMTRKGKGEILEGFLS